MSEVAVGDIVDGKYRIVRLIGEGGWGVVYEAENARTLKRVAVKILRPRPELTADIRTRFEREAQAAGRIGSEHIVEVFDLGTLGDGTHYMVMELLTGQDLASRLVSGGRMDPVAAAKLVLQLLDGLAAAHAAGILHRDLKPENLFLVATRSGEDFVKILDFGISKFNAPELTSATITGAVLGSPVYMAPEQARGLKHVDARTDLYSVGVLLFEAVTGRVPFMGENFNDLMFKIALAPRPNPLHLRPDLDPAMAAILVKAIAADPKERFPSSGAFHTALTDWLCAQGVTSVAAPELRHALNTTPRLSGSRKSSPQHSEPWSDATMPSEIVAGTPLAASSTLGDQSPRKKHAAMIGALLAGMVLVGLVGGLAAVRRVKAPVQTATAAAPPEPSIATETPPPAVEKTVAPATAEATLTPAVTLTESAALAPPSNAPAAAHHPPPGAGASRPQPRTSKSATAGASSTPPSEPSQRVESATAPPSAAPPASAPKRVDSVEGREFRTGL